MAQSLVLPARTQDVAPPRTRRKGDESPRIGELDGLRAIAIALVLVYHALGDGPGLRALRALPGPFSASWIPVAHAWLGVDLFFVLSGFLITGILLDSRERPRYYRNFYIRRALRILPVLLLVIACMAVAFPGPAAYWILALLFCANLAPLLHVAVPAVAAPLWSLAVEEQFYLIWPTFVRRLPRNTLFWIAGAICLIVPLARMVSPHLDTAIRLTWLRCDGLAFGALVALWIRSPQACGKRAALPILGALLASATIFAVESHLHAARIGAALRVSEADLVFASAVLAAYVWRGSPATAFLRSGLAGFVAGTSYCAYLIHVSVFSAVDAMGWTASSSALESGLLRLFCGVPIVFAIAALSKAQLEDPVLEFKSELAPRSSA